MSEIKEAVAKAIGDVTKETLSKVFAASAERLAGSLEKVTSVSALIATPFYFLGLVGDRANAFLERVIARVPEEERCKASPSLVGEVLEGVRGRDVGDPAMRMFEQLLEAAIRRVSSGNAHPAFAKLIAGMSPDEAMVIAEAQRSGGLGLVYRGDSYTRGRGNEPMPPHRFPLEQLAEPDNIRAYAERQESEGLLERNNTHLPEDLRYAPTIGSPWHYYWFQLSEFGRLFASVCIPQND